MTQPSNDCSANKITKRGPGSRNKFEIIWLRTQKWSVKILLGTFKYQTLSKVWYRGAWSLRRWRFGEACWVDGYFRVFQAEYISSAVYEKMHWDFSPLPDLSPKRNKLQHRTKATGTHHKASSKMRSSHMWNYFPSAHSSIVWSSTNLPPSNFYVWSDNSVYTSSRMRLEVITPCTLTVWSFTFDRSQT